MFPDDIKEKIKLYLPGFRGILLSVLAVLLSRFATINLEYEFRASFGAIEADFQFFPAQLMIHLTFLAAVLIAVILPFYYIDNVDLFNKRDYLKENSRRSILTRPRYLVGLVIGMLGSIWILSGSFRILFSFFGIKGGPWLDICAVLCSLCAMAIIRAIQLTSLQSKWNSEHDNPLFAEKAMFKRNRDAESFKPHQLILQPLGYSIVYMVCAFIVINGLPLAGLSFKLTDVIIGIWIVLFGLWYAFLIVPLAIFLLVTLFRILYSIPKRRLLLKYFKRMEKEQLAEVSIKGPRYIGALFAFARPLEVTVKVSDDEIYNCLVISGGKVNAPIFFKEDEYMVEHGLHLRRGALVARGGAYAQVVDIRSWGGKTNPTNMIFGYRSAHKLNFASVEGKLTILLNPTPTTAYAIYENECKAIDTGEIIGNYTVHTATAFFNHIERRSRAKHRFDD